MENTDELPPGKIRCVECNDDKYKQNMYLLKIPKRSKNCKYKKLYFCCQCGFKKFGDGIMRT